VDRSCIFCKIIEKSVKADVVYEDAHVLAFRDLNPQAPVHVLIVPKQHISSAAMVKEDGMWGHLMGAVTLVARSLGLEDNGYRLVINCGAQAGQTIPHLHVHLLAGRSFRWPPG
jgi:histidine triad (HIT) family protein